MQILLQMLGAETTIENSVSIDAGIITKEEDVEAGVPFFQEFVEENSKRSIDTFPIDGTSRQTLLQDSRLSEIFFAERGSGMDVIDGKSIDSTANVVALDPQVLEWNKIEELLSEEETQLKQKIDLPDISKASSEGPQLRPFLLANDLEEAKASIPDASTSLEKRKISTDANSRSAPDFANAKTSVPIAKTEATQINSEAAVTNDRPARKFLPSAQLPPTTPEIAVERSVRGENLSTSMRSERTSVDAPAAALTRLPPRPSESIPAGEGFEQRPASIPTAEVNKARPIELAREPVTSNRPEIAITQIASSQSLLPAQSKIQGMLPKKDDAETRLSTEQLVVAQKPSVGKEVATTQISPQSTSLPFAATWKPFEQTALNETSHHKGDFVVHATTGGGQDTRAEKTGAKPDVAARPVMQQMAQAARHAGDGSVEVKLSPEELGRVRLALTPGETNIVVHITVERPETLELIRRNIEMLAQSLRDEGFSDPTFSFEQLGADSNSTNTGDLAERTTDEKGIAEDTASSGAQAIQQNLPSGQLDIRL